MKTYILGFCTLFIALISRAQTNGTCTLTGDIKGLGNHRVFISYCYDTAARSLHRDSVRAHHGHFVYQAHLEAPVLAYIHFYRNHKPLIKRETGMFLTYRIHRFRNPAMAGLILENRDMHWRTRLDSVDRSHPNNAPMTDTLAYYYDLYNKLYRSDSALSKWRVEWRKWKLATKHKKNAYMPEELKAWGDSVRQAVWERSKDSISAYITFHPSSPLRSLH